jgi:hypothetical protein
MQQFSDVMTGINHTKLRPIRQRILRKTRPSRRGRGGCGGKLVGNWKSVDDSEAQAGQAVTVF